MYGVLQAVSRFAKPQVQDSFFPQFQHYLPPETDTEVLGVHPSQNKARRVKPQWRRSGGELGFVGCNAASAIDVKFLAPASPCHHSPRPPLLLNTLNFACTLRENISHIENH